ncbi:MAG: PAS domain-containing sensor histidine kinase [Rubrivivax sp.]|nr:MAG: PAS domain-containing sensor histidine kinase [Rubrivivax sp.]
MDEPAAAAPLTAQALYEDAPCGLMVTSPDGVIQRVNRTFCSWIGRDASELVGKRRLQDLLTMGGRIFHQTHWAPLMAIQGSVAEVKLELIHSDGRKLPAVWNARRGGHGEQAVHEVAVFVAEDRHRYEQELLRARRTAEELLAQEQAAQQALRASQSERDRLQALAEDRAHFAEQMVAIVSHDLRNPLSVIQMSAQLLSRTTLDARQSLALERLERSTRRAVRLISDVLDFSRGRLGPGLPANVQPIELHKLVAEALADLRVAWPSRHIDHLLVGAGPCVGAPDRLTQLLGNLVANAVSYGAPDAPVVVTSSIGADTFSITVQNHGDPIPGALLPTLFDAMTRGMTPPGDATSVGLGLFIVREIAHAHGGTIGVVSTRETGTIFTATFPRSAGADTDEAGASPT